MKIMQIMMMVMVMMMGMIDAEGCDGDGTSNGADGDACTHLLTNYKLPYNTGIIKHILALSPGLSWEMLSSRIVSKKQIAPLKTQEERQQFSQKCADVIVEAKQLKLEDREPDATYLMFSL